MESYGVKDTLKKVPPMQQKLTKNHIKINRGPVRAIIGQALPGKQLKLEAWHHKEAPDSRVLLMVASLPNLLSQRVVLQGETAWARRHRATKQEDSSLRGVLIAIITCLNHCIILSGKVKPHNFLSSKLPN